MRITITIDTGNAAFEDDHDTELKRVLSQVIRWLRPPTVGAIRLYDINGNTVGKVEVSE